MCVIEHLDATRKHDLTDSISAACAEMGKIATIHVKKNTDTVLRYSVEYQSISEQAYPLKLEISFRNKLLLNQGYLKPVIINGIRTYGLSDMFNLKMAAFLGRDKVRDFYDIAWFALHH